MESYEVKIIELDEILYKSIVKAKNSIIAVNKALKEMELNTGINTFSNVEVHYIPKNLI